MWLLCVALVVSTSTTWKTSRIFSVEVGAPALLHKENREETRLLQKVFEGSVRGLVSAGVSHWHPTDLQINSRVKQIRNCGLHLSTRNTSHTRDTNAGPLACATGFDPGETFCQSFRTLHVCQASQEYSRTTLRHGAHFAASLWSSRESGCELAYDVLCYFGRTLFCIPLLCQPEHTMERLH